MDSFKPCPAPTRSKLAKAFQKMMHLRTATKALSNNGFCLSMPHEKLKCCDLKKEFQNFEEEEDSGDETKVKNRAAMEAFAAKVFAAVSAVKAAYAELQAAQFPYDGDSIQCADQAVVDELRSISELKQSFLKKQIDPSPPHLTLMLAEIQEQQSLMKTYEITMKKMQSDVDAREKEIFSLQSQLHDAASMNKSMEKTLNASGPFSILDNVKHSDSNPGDFVTVLTYALRSVRNFVKLMVREMESANWDIDEAAQAIEPGIVYSKPNHRCYAFESFVSREIFNGFQNPNFNISKENFPDAEQRQFLFFDRFRKLKSTNPIHFLKQNPNSTFGKFLKSKYLGLVHPKMETSFSGNLNQRKMVSAGEFPETEFFRAFAEMARRVWLLHCLALSFDQQVNIFQVRKDCRFSEVFMENVTEDAFSTAEADGDFRVAFTVVPGFRLGKTVIQCQVYVSPGR